MFFISIFPLLGDGHIDPYSLTQALAVGARNYGAEIYLSSPVTEISPHRDGQWNVHTPHGVITAKKIVNAAGAILFDIKKPVNLAIYISSQFRIIN